MLHAMKTFYCSVSFFICFSKHDTKFKYWKSCNSPTIKMYGD